MPPEYLDEDYLEELRRDELILQRCDMLNEGQGGTIWFGGRATAPCLHCWLLAWC